MLINDKSNRLLKLAIPATIENLLQTLVGFIDTLMISRLGLIAVSAVGLSNNIFAVYIAVITALGVATSSLISRHLGAKRVTAANNVAVQSTSLALISGLLLGTVSLLFNQQILALLGADGEVANQALPYFNIVGGGSVFIFLLTVFGSILRASGDTKTPMLVNSLVNILNITLDYILIFGMGPIPALGILGTAIGTVVARLIGSVLMFLKIQRTELAFNLGDLFRKEKYDRNKDLISLSVPAVLERLVMRVGQVVYYGLIFSMGVKTYSAHVIAGNIESFTYMPAYGLATAASILVGNNFGAGKLTDAREYGARSVKLGAIIMALGGVVLFFGSPLFAGWFTQDIEAIEKIVIALRIDAFAQIPLAVSLISAGALQGSGDTKTPLYSTAIGMWGVRVLGVYFFGIRLGMDIAGVWLSILIDLSIRAVFLAVKFRKRTSVA